MKWRSTKRTRGTFWCSILMPTEASRTTSENCTSYRVLAAFVATLFFLRRPPLCIYIHNIARETGSVHAIEFFSKYDLERSPRHRSLGAERECRCLTRIVLFRQFLTPRTEVPPFRQRKTIQLKVPPRRLGGLASVTTSKHFPLGTHPPEP